MMCQNLEGLLCMRNQISLSYSVCSKAFLIGTKHVAHYLRELRYRKLRTHFYQKPIASKADQVDLKAAWMWQYQKLLLASFPPTTKSFEQAIAPAAGIAPLLTLKHLCMSPALNI